VSMLKYRLVVDRVTGAPRGSIVISRTLAILLGSDLRTEYLAIVLIENSGPTPTVRIGFIYSMAIVADFFHSRVPDYQ